MKLEVEVRSEVYMDSNHRAEWKGSERLVSIELMSVVAVVVLTSVLTREVVLLSAMMRECLQSCSALIMDVHACWW